MGKNTSVNENRKGMEFHYDTFTVIQTTAALINIYDQIIFPLQNSIFHNNSRRQYADTICSCEHLQPIAIYVRSTERQYEIAQEFPSDLLPGGLKEQ